MMNNNISTTRAKEKNDKVILSSSDEDTNYEPPAKAPKLVSSSVHKEFDQSKDEKGKWKSKCKHCTKEKIYSHKNPTGLWEHLRKNHHAVFIECKKKDDKEKEDLKIQSKHKEYPVQKGPSSSGHKASSEALFGPMDKFVASQTQRNLPKWKQKKDFVFWGSSFFHHRKRGVPPLHR